MAKMYLPPDAKRSGIDVTYHKKENVLIEEYYTPPKQRRNQEPQP